MARCEQHNQTFRSVCPDCELADMGATSKVVEPTDYHKGFNDGFAKGTAQAEADIQRLRWGWQAEQRRHASTQRALWDAQDALAAETPT